MKTNILIINCCIIFSPYLHSDEVTSPQPIPWPKEPPITPLMEEPEVYRASLEDYRESLEGVRQAYEDGRINREINRDSYLEGIEKYRNNIGLYRSGIEKYREGF